MKERPAFDCGHSSEGQEIGWRRGCVATRNTGKTPRMRKAHRQDKREGKKGLGKKILGGLIYQRISGRESELLTGETKKGLRLTTGGGSGMSRRWKKKGKYSGERRREIDRDLQKKGKGGNVENRRGMLGGWPSREEVPR